ncbi:MAG: hypothetical protein HGA42_19775, partial [Nostocales cyanobacterium W4_Combined_metabat2_030]|nr:hypothetical protein [Nostocales cyanobacterium W4_Combined_metabat2_030]
MKRFLLLSLIAISLLSSFSAFAQTPIITMATSNSTVNLNIYWTGTGKVYANGSSLPSYTNTTVKVVNEKVEVTSSGDTQILQVYCNKNNLTSLDISNCPTIQNLDCSSNNLTSIDISKNVLLYQLNCYENQITSIDITKNTRMQYLSCSDNKLSSLLTTNITKLERLISSENPISSIDVSTNTNLIELNLMYCNLSDLKLSHFSSNIEKLDLSYNPLKTISLENLPNLKNFSCIGYIINKTLTDIDLSFNTKLQTLNVNTQLLKKLD